MKRIRGSSMDGGFLGVRLFFPFDRYIGADRRKCVNTSVYIVLYFCEDIHQKEATLFCDVKTFQYVS